MAQPFFVDHEGRVLSDTTKITPTPEVVPESLDSIAAREAAKQSTPKHQ